MALRLPPRVARLRGLSITALLIGSLFPSLVSGQQFNPATNHWYEVGNRPEKIDRARVFAAHLGGFLVTINDAAEESWILDNIAPSPSVSQRIHLGLSDETVEGDLVWDSGEPVTFTNFGPNQNLENLDYCRLEVNTQLWNFTNLFFSSAVPVIETDHDVPERMAEVTCGPEGLGVRVNWVAAMPYDEIDIFRESDLIATLPGSTTTYFDDEPEIPSTDYYVSGRVGGFASYPVHCESRAVDLNHQMYIPDASVPEGGVLTTSILADVPGPLSVHGSFISVIHDPVHLDVVAVTAGAEVLAENGGAPPLFQNLEVLADRVRYSAVYIDLGSGTIPPGNGLELLSMEYDSISASPSTTTLTFEQLESQGYPGMNYGADIFLPFTTPGTISIVDVSFRRGDCTGDGALDIADAINTGDYLFLGADLPPCLAACDSNGDGNVDIGDVVFSLFYLFQQGPAPPAPFPDCSVPPTMPTLGCDEVVCP